MMRASISFFISAVIAYIFGFYGLSGISMEIGETLLVIFLFLAAISFIAALVMGPKTSRQQYL